MRLSGMDFRCPRTASRRQRRTQEAEEGISGRSASYGQWPGYVAQKPKRRFSSRPKTIDLSPMPSSSGLRLSPQRLAVVYRMTMTADSMPTLYTEGTPHSPTTSRVFIPRCSEYLAPSKRSKA
jgi:hypothetical protein